MNTTTDALRWRYATTVFDVTKTIPKEDLNAVLEAGNLMPTCFGLQPFRIVTVTNQAIKETLREATFGQAHAIENSALIVIATRTDISDAMIDEYIARIEKTRGMPNGSASKFGDSIKRALVALSGEAKADWATRQAYIALGGMIAEASLRGIDNHALEGFSQEQYNAILGLKERNLHARVLLALGYRADGDAQEKVRRLKVRVPQDEMVIRM